jgi:Disulphide bond corrector protein DsbC
MIFRRIQLALLLGPGLCAVGAAPAPSEIVRWSASVVSKTPVKPGSVATLELSATVEDGWHVYALTQLPNGPTPLRVALDSNGIAEANGSPSGTAPEKKFDQSFELETQFYTRAFTIRLPVRVRPQPAAGRKLIPVSVRFQSCNGQVCEPPTTIHLSAAIDVLPTPPQS